MRIALYGPLLFGLAAGLRENQANEVHVFLDEDTLPPSLVDDPHLHDSSLVSVGPWATRQAILHPGSAPITRMLADSDVALVTELGPIFSQHIETPFFFIPNGWDLTCGPFPIRSRSSRPRGLADLSAVVVAARLRSGIRAATGIWGAPFRPFALAVERLGCLLSADLPQAIDTSVFAPRVESDEAAEEFEGLTIFHPSRMMFTPDPFLVETGQCKRNDVFLRGFANAVAQGVNARLMLVDRVSSPNQELTRRVIAELGVHDRVEWLNGRTSLGFTGREMADLYRSSDLVVDDFGGWLGLVALEGASCGKPVLNCLEAAVMESQYPGGHPFVQAADEDQVCEAITILADADRRAEIGHASRRWILEHHARTVVARKCEMMLDEQELSKSGAG